MTGPPSYPPYTPYPPYPPVRPSRPWQVEWAWRLMIGVTAMSGLVVISDESLKGSGSSFESSGQSDPSAPYAGTYVYLAVLGLYLLFAFKARNGRSSAQTGAPIMTALVFLVMTPYCWLGFTNAYDVFGPGSEEYGPVYAVLTMLALAIAIPALALIYLPASNSYFRHVRAAPPPPPPRRW